MADSPWPFGDQTGSKRAFRKTGGDGPSGTAGLQFAGRGTFQIHAQVVQATRSGQASTQRRIQNAMAFVQQLPCMGEREALKKVFRSYARPAGKEAVKMKRVQAEVAGQFGQVRLFRVVFV